MASHRVTLRDIAEKAGVHLATVSRALAHQPGIPPKTCDRIQKIAKELGYVPDPMLSALAAYRKRIQTTTYHGNLAWVTNAFTREGWNTCETFALYWEGALKAAEELGYQLEEFWLREPSLNVRRASDVLTARNISGLILPPQPRAKMRIRLDWHRFSAVTLGHTLVWPSLHRVATSQFFSMQKLIRHVRALGYRRIGLIADPLASERVSHGWTGGFLVLQQHWPRTERLPVLEFTLSNMKPSILWNWIEKYRPDVVVSHDFHVLEAMKTKGLRIPEDIGYVNPGLARASELSGIDENPRQVGASAVQFLVGMINRSETGMPTLPSLLTLGGTWNKGATVCRQGAK